MNDIIQFIVTNLPLVLCLLTGVGLLVLEVFMPGFGLPGTSGIILMLAGIIMTFTNYGVAAGLAVTLITLAVAGISITVSIKSAASGRISKSALVLNNVIQPEENERMNALAGKEGQALTVLNPVGTAEIEGMRLSVVSEGEWIEKDARVQVMLVEGSRVVVREIKG